MSGSVEARLRNLLARRRESLLDSVEALVGRAAASPGGVGAGLREVAHLAATVRGRRTAWDLSPADLTRWAYHLWAVLAAPDPRMLHAPARPPRAAWAHVAAHEGHLLVVVWWDADGGPSPGWAAELRGQIATVLDIPRDCVDLQSLADTPALVREILVREGVRLDLPVADPARPGAPPTLVLTPPDVEWGPPPAAATIPSEAAADAANAVAPVAADDAEAGDAAAADEDVALREAVRARAHAYVRYAVDALELTVLRALATVPGAHALLRLLVALVPDDDPGSGSAEAAASGDEPADPPAPQDPA